MRVVIYGASGRVGKCLINAVSKDQDASLVAGIVSPASPYIGDAISDSGLKYSNDISSVLSNCDLIIDFSSPRATNALLDTIKGKGVPLVIGTTGFDELLQKKIDRISEEIPILQGANFAHGFESFLKAAIDLIHTNNPISARICEVYHKNKRQLPSGTSFRMANEVAHALRPTQDSDLPEVPIDIAREGETVGINSVILNLGVSEIDLKFTVHTLDSYAKGALEAGKRLVNKAAGLYTPKDMI